MSTRKKALTTRELKQLVIAEVELDATDDWRLIISDKLLSTETTKGKLVMGEMSHDERVIVISPSHHNLNELLTTYVHELLHKLFPKWPERKIYSASEKIVHDMAPSEKQKVMAGLFSQAEWSDA